MKPIIKKNQKKRLSLDSYHKVAFPGRIFDISKCIKMLGGMNKIGKNLLGDDNETIILKFRPEDELSHGVQGKNCEIAGMVLSTTVDIQNNKVLDYEIKGKIGKNIVFNDLCDFQSVSRTHFNLTNENVEQKLNLPPPQFSTYEKPFKYQFKENTNTIITEQFFEDGKSLKVKQLKKVSTGFSTVFVDFTDKSIPSECPIENRKKSEESQCYKIIKKLFSIRPIWTNTAIFEIVLSKIKTSKNQIKITIPLLSYKFSSGPFKNCLIKFGVDPRSDSKYAKYQLMPFRVPREMRKYLGKKNSYLFKGIPNKINCNYQYCDIRIRKVIDFLEKWKVNKTCTEENGWVTKKSWTKIDKYMKKKLRSWCKKGNSGDDEDIIIEEINLDPSEEEEEEDGEDGKEKIEEE